LQFRVVSEAEWYGSKCLNTFDKGRIVSLKFGPILLEKERFAGGAMDGVSEEIVKKISLVIILCKYTAGRLH
jgi:hypothetical protein